MVRVTDVKGGFLDLSQALTVTKDVFEDFTRRYVPQRGDIVFSRVGTYGNASYVTADSPFCLGQNTALIHPKIDGRFLHLCLQSLSSREQIEQSVVGSTQKTISLKSIGALEVPVPPKQELQAIAHILGTLDDKIELNRWMNETLEGMARALFQSWFVDFDPVRAKAEGRDPGLPKPLADLFPARFVDSELGEIPEGWDVATLPDVVAVNPTRALRKGVEAPYLDMANMPTHGHSADEIVDRTFGSGMRFINGDTLVARITPCLENGKTAFVDFLQDGQVGWGSTEYIVLRPKSPLPEEYAYCLARSAEFRDFAIQGMTGTSGRQRVPAESLAHFRVAVPPKPVAESFGWAAKPTFARASAATRDCRTLAALRDALLPKLISGQLQVRTNAVDTLTSCASPDLDMHD